MPHPLFDTTQCGRILRYVVVERALQTQGVTHVSCGIARDDHRNWNQVCTLTDSWTKKLNNELTLKVLVATIDAQWEGMGDVGSERYELALLPPCPTIRVLSYSN